MAIYQTSDIVGTVDKDTDTTIDVEMVSDE